MKRFLAMAFTALVMQSASVAAQSVDIGSYGSVKVRIPGGPSVDIDGGNVTVDTGDAAVGVNSGGTNVAVEESGVSAAAAVNLENGYIEDQSFSGKNLAGAVFANATLVNVDFSGADLRGAVFTNASFENVNLSNADLRRAVFQNASILNSDMRGSLVKGATFINATFDGTKIAGVDFSTAVMTNADLTGADYSTAAVMSSDNIRKSLVQKTEAGGENEDARQAVNLAIHFAFDSDELEADGYEQLARLAEALKSEELAKSRILVEGHTDSKGGDSYNLSLSNRRAERIVKTLANAYGIDRSRLESKGYGESLPVADNNTDFGRSQNRRVTVVNVSAE